MNLKFFTDHCIPNYVIKKLKEAGYEVLRLRDYIPCDSSDSVVISKAQELNAILISLNGDFSNIVAYPPADYRGIISLQVRNHPEIITHLMEVLLKYLSGHTDMIYYKGKLIVVEVHHIRLRE
jgi:predicted nuclease of predicted toxin-antitoxin system